LRQPNVSATVLEQSTEGEIEKIEKEIMEENF
jgi:hypothetical protein